jgi:hypothetical protein
VKSLRAISMRAAEWLQRAVFHATNRGSNAGDYIAKKQHATGEWGSVIARIYWEIA